MPRWLYVTICLVLFNVTMALIWFGLKTWGSPSLSSFYDWAGSTAAWATLAIVAVMFAVIGYWPREPNGRFRYPLPRRR